MADEHDALEQRRDELSPDEASRLLLLTDVLDEIKTADIIYPQPTLVDQIKYLYEMVSKADQAPGVEAADRYTELAAKFAALQEKYENGQ